MAGMLLDLCSALVDPQVSLGLRGTAPGHNLLLAVTTKLSTNKDRRAPAMACPRKAVGMAPARRPNFAAREQISRDRSSAPPCARCGQSRAVQSMGMVSTGWPSVSSLKLLAIIS